MWSFANLPIEEVREAVGFFTKKDFDGIGEAEFEEILKALQTGGMDCNKHCIDNKIVIETAHPVQGASKNHFKIWVARVLGIDLGEEEDEEAAKHGLDEDEESDGEYERPRKMAKTTST